MTDGNEYPEVAFLPCPCCQYVTMHGWAIFDICPVYGWEDDGIVDLDQDPISGPNRGLSLRKGRRNFQRIGASHERLLRLVRAPRPDEYPPVVQQ